MNYKCFSLIVLNNYAFPRLTRVSPRVSTMSHGGHGGDCDGDDEGYLMPSIWQELPYDLIQRVTPYHSHPCLTMNQKQREKCVHVRLHYIQTKVQTMIDYLYHVAYVASLHALGHTRGAYSIQDGSTRINYMRSRWNALMSPPRHLAKHTHTIKRGDGVTLQEEDPVEVFDRYNTLCKGRIVAICNDTNDTRRYEVEYSTWGRKFTEMKTKREITHPHGLEDVRVLAGPVETGGPLTAHMQYFWVPRGSMGYMTRTRLMVNTLKLNRTWEEGSSIFARVVYGATVATNYTPDNSVQLSIRTTTVLHGAKPHDRRPWKMFLMGGGAASEVQDYMVPPANRTTRNFLPRLHGTPDMIKEIYKYLRTQD